MFKRKKARAAVKEALAGRVDWLGRIDPDKTDPARVFAAFEALVAVDPTYENWRWYGRILRDYSKPELAANAFRMAADASGEFQDYLNAAELYQLAGNPAMAERMFLLVVPIRHKSIYDEQRILTKYVEFLANQGRFDDARTAIDQATERNHWLKRFELCRGLAELLGDKGLVEEAKDEYDNALEPFTGQNAYIAGIHYDHGHWLTELGDVQRAVEAYERAERALNLTGLDAYWREPNVNELGPRRVLI